MSMCFRVVEFKFCVIFIVVNCKISKYLDIQSDRQPYLSRSAQSRSPKKNHAGCSQLTWATENEHVCDQWGQKGKNSSFQGSSFGGCNYSLDSSRDWAQQLSHFCIFQQSGINHWFLSLPWHFTGFFIFFFLSFF